MFDFSQVIDSVLFSPAGCILDNVALDERDFIGVDVLHRLNHQILVVFAANLLVSCAHRLPL